MTPAEASADVLAKVTGAARYTSDLDLAGMLQVALVRSNAAHGRIVSIDTSVAATMPGVQCIVTADDFGDIDPFYGELVNDQPMLAVDRVRYVGEPICAVVARTRAEALEAARYVDVDIAVLPALLDPDQAVAPGAEPVHAEFPSHSPAAPNVCREARLDVGDVEEAFAGAAFVHHGVYTCPAVYHYAMEPHCSIASWEDGRLVVHSGTQQPFRVRDTLSRMFSLPTSRVSVRAPFVGGAYGSKGETKYEPLAALAALIAGRPVKLLISVEEAFHTVSRHACRVEMWTALDSSGTITARRSDVVFDTGAYADKGPRIAMRGAIRVSGPYRIPNLKVRSRAVYTHKVPAGAFRGFSTSQVLWASESAMDEIAILLGEDPVEYRLRHVIRGQDRYSGVDAPVDSDLAQSVRTASAAIGHNDHALPANVGRAIALGVKDGGGGAAHASAVIHLHPDGSVEVLAGATELGQGAHRVLGDLAADALGIPPEHVDVRLGDTDSSPFDRGTNASRTTVGLGLAIEDAGHRIQEILTDAWARSGRDGVPHLDGGDLVNESARAAIPQVFSEALGLPAREFPGVTVTGSHVAVPAAGSTEFETMFFEVGTAGAEVRVDTDTGQIEISRMVSVIEAGKALSLRGSHGQNVGAAMMGIGTTLSEQLLYVAGELQNANMIEYRVPTMGSLPSQGIESLLIENGDGPGPQGAKGLGEAGIIAVAPAIANALQAAVGVRIRDLPLTPESVWRAMSNRVDPELLSALPREAEV